MIRRLLWCWLLLPLVSQAAQPSPWQRPFSEVAALDFRTADRRIQYGGAKQQFIDLWLPEGAEPAPVVVLVHGGCWLAQYTIDHIRPLATALARAGFAVWAPEYRRIGDEGGGWPGTFLDIGRAVDYLAETDLERLDLKRVVFAGHSAGGHLALWAAGRVRLQPEQVLYSAAPFVPRGVIGLAAITDLAAYAQGDNSCQQVTVQLLGGTPDRTPDRYAQGSPLELGSDVPTVLMQGEADRIVPTEQASALSTARVEWLPGAGHFDLIHPGTAAFPRLLALLGDLLTL